jgi:hypothetical protein
MLIIKEYMFKILKLFIVHKKPHRRLGLQAQSAQGPERPHGVTGKD